MSSVITVSQLNRYLASKLRSDLKLKGIAVKGEISNFNIHYKSGHAYFTVKDSSSALKAVMFSSSVSRLKFVPEDGMSVLVMGNIEVYERDGVYQIIATEIAPLGVGVMHVQLEQTKALPCVQYRSLSCTGTRCDSGTNYMQSFVGG